ncbi:MAG: hypothetical protein R3C29_15825 [Dehalococcoidia bacterium]
MCGPAGGSQGSDVGIEADEEGIRMATGSGQHPAAITGANVDGQGAIVLPEGLDQGPVEAA